MAIKKRSLGKSLDALLVGSSPDTSLMETSNLTQDSSDTIRELDVNCLKRGQYQPRTEFDPDTLEELANSIRAQGVIQPIIVRPVTEDQYEIIAGERRWRAAKLADLTKVPVIIKDIPNEAAIAMSLIENIQREDLNPIEEAIALQRLLDEFSMTHQLIAEAVGKSRSTVTNLLRLLSLNEDVKTMLARNDIEMGHARALLTLDDEKQISIAKTVVAKGLSVRETEALVHRHQDSSPKKPIPKVNPEIEDRRENLATKLNTKVAIQQGSQGKGKITIQYRNLTELDAIIERIQ